MTTLFINYIKALGKDGDDIKLEFSHVNRASLILRALNNKLRQSILKLLEQSNRLTVTEICIELKLEQSVASQHLSVLRRSNIVKFEREGKLIYYQLNQQGIADIWEFVIKMQEDK